MLPPLRTLTIPLVGSMILAACGGGNAASQLAKAPDYNPKDQTKCGVAKSQERPLIVEWPSADRLELESKTRQGLVAVRYVGCEMDVLERCSVNAKYNYVGGTRKQDELDINDEDDLYANLPVGAAKLEGKLQRSGKLTVKMDLVGRYESEKTSVRADELQGDCAGATHFIYGVTLGAFDFYGGGSADVGGGVGVGGVGAGAHSQADRTSITKDGDPDACAKSTEDDKVPPSGCRALIRIEVVPIGEAKALTPTCPDGTQWDGTQTQCVGRKVVTQVDCPTGSTWDGAHCAASVSTQCATGMHFERGTGCVPDVVQAGTSSPTGGCQSDGDCRQGRVCQAGTCVGQPTSASGCQSNADCRGGRVCQAGSCVGQPQSTSRRK